MLMIGIMGRAIQNTRGPKYVWLLYGLGSLFAGLSTAAFQPPSPYIMPQVGVEGALAAYITFIGCMNPHATFLFFVFPVKAWVLLAMLGGYSLLFDPHKKYFAGMTAGFTVFNMMRLGMI
jgi:membrane associated rhomboid family serine protease